MSRIIDLSLGELAKRLQAGELSCTQAVEACLDQIAATEPNLDALLLVMDEQARARAEELDAAGPDPAKPLWGTPIVLKDLLATKDVETTCASKILQGYAPPFTATAVARLEEAGAVIIGKANMDEFAMGSSNETSAYKLTRNPWDTSRVPGGSSGGSAVSVAARQCFGALGTDTGGSIRLPAAFCGCVGLKPSYGRISRYGLIAYGSSLDQIGPLARTVPDAARLLTVMAGRDERDSTSVDAPVPDYEAALGRDDLKGMKIGLPREYWAEGIDDEIRTVLTVAIDRARDLGAEIVEVDLPHAKYAIATYYIIAMAEASSNLARFDGVRYGYRDKDAAELIDMYTRTRTHGFGDEVQRRIIIGTYVLSAGYYDAYYRKAAQIRRLIRRDFDEALARCDVLAGPACPVPAFPLGDKTDDPLTMYLMDIYTISLNLAGLPGLSLPAGLGPTTGMPIGLQLFGGALAEETLLACGDVLERTLEPLPTPPGC
jgi:aspartyl-tRNA(Asn)/glutamyl-tRNA(Gln) amidotransferase subunit A